MAKKTLALVLGVDIYVLKRNSLCLLLLSLCLSLYEFNFHFELSLIFEALVFNISSVLWVFEWDVYKVGTRKRIKGKKK